MTKIWHNPRCSKSRQTLQLLQDKGIEPEIVEYLKGDITATDIETVIALLNIRPHQLLRTKEAEYKEAGLNADADGATVIAAMVAYPKLIERPIVISNGQARIGRPPEDVLDII